VNARSEGFAGALRGLSSRQQYQSAFAGTLELATNAEDLEALAEARGKLTAQVSIRRCSSGCSSDCSGGCSSDCSSGCSGAVVHVRHLRTNRMSPCRRDASLVMLKRGIMPRRLHCGGWPRSGSTTHVLLAAACLPSSRGALLFLKIRSLLNFVPPVCQ